MSATNAYVVEGDGGLSIYDLVCMPQDDLNLVSDGTPQTEKMTTTIARLRTAVGVLLVLCILSTVVIIALAVLSNINIRQAEDDQGAPPKDARFKLEWPEPSASPLGKYVHAAIAADNGYCSEIGRDTIIRGGNVIHAAIATAFCIGIMDAHSSGIGGGAFINIYNKTTQKCTIIDAREVAPIAASKNMYVNKKDEAVKGWKASGVPGEVHGLYTAYKMAGEAVSWKSLIEPTVKLLRLGQPVSEALANAIEKVKKDIKDKASNLDIFMHEDGRLYKRSDILKRPIVADTLEQLANAPDPLKHFYNSQFTDRLVQDIQRGGGIITKEDMQKYRSETRKQSETIYTEMDSGITGCGPPPPSSSAVTLSIINVMAGYRFDNLEHTFRNLDSTTSVFHELIEAMKFAYAARSELGDIKFIKTALEAAKNISSRTYDQLVRDKIRRYGQPEAAYGGTFVDGDSGPGGTSHIAVMDVQGNAVSLTTTINTYMGAKRRSPSTGIIMNNQMDDFSTPGLKNYFGFPPSPNNYIVPGKRPLSSMSPIILFHTEDKKAVLAIGCAGGSKIISSTASVAFRALQLKETIKQAVDAPRLHDQLRPFYVQYEPDFPPQIVSSLSLRGQDMKEYHHASVVTAVMRGTDDDPYLYANSDFRKGEESFCSGV